MGCRLQRVDPVEPHKRLAVRAGERTARDVHHEADVAVGLGRDRHHNGLRERVAWHQDCLRQQSSNLVAMHTPRTAEAPRVCSCCHGFAHGVEARHTSCDD